MRKRGMRLAEPFERRVWGGGVFSLELEGHKSVNETQRDTGIAPASRNTLQRPYNMVLQKQY